VARKVKALQTPAHAARVEPDLELLRPNNTELSARSMN
jgi:hypothetical protein